MKKKDKKGFWHGVVHFFGWLFHFLGLLIERVGKFFLWVWGLSLASVLVSGLTFLSLAVGMKNLDQTNLSERFWDKLDPIVDTQIEKLGMEIESIVNKSAELNQWKDSLQGSVIKSLSPFLEGEEKAALEQLEKENVVVPVNVSPSTQEASRFKSLD